MRKMSFYAAGSSTGYSRFDLEKSANIRSSLFDKECRCTYYRRASDTVYEREKKKRMKEKEKKEKNSRRGRKNGER